MTEAEFPHSQHVREMIEDCLEQEIPDNQWHSFRQSREAARIWTLIRSEVIKYFHTPAIALFMIAWRVRQQFSLQQRTTGTRLDQISREREWRAVLRAFDQSLDEALPGYLAAWIERRAKVDERTASLRASELRSYLELVCTGEGMPYEGMAVEELVFGRLPNLDAAQMRRDPKRFHWTKYRFLFCRKCREVFRQRQSGDPQLYCDGCNWNVTEDMDQHHCCVCGTLCVREPTRKWLGFTREIVCTNCRTK